MKLLLRLAFALLLFVLVAAGTFVLLVGPWPLYRDSHYASKGYFRQSLRNIDEAAAKTQLTADPAPLRAGWAERDVTPEVGYPMGGYGGRKNDKRSEGVREPIYVRALALNDGTDTLVLMGTDLLQTLPNLLELVEVRTERSVGLTNANILWTSSHTHCGPGGFAPGMIAEMSFGAYSPEYIQLLADRCSEAIEEAVDTMAPARLAMGAVAVPEFIRNRTRIGGPVDDVLHWAIAEKPESGERIHVARYSAHGTAYGEEMMLFNNDFAGAFQRAVREQTGAMLLYMGGAVGAMRPYPPGAPEPETPGDRLAFENDIESRQVREGKKTLATMLRDQEARVEAMGQGLAERLLAAHADAVFQERLDLASFDAAYIPPPAQARLLSPDWRMSPFLFNLLGIPKVGRLQAARIGDVVLIGMPYDLGGETSLVWQDWAREHGASALWATSFSGAYLGYLSPDANYYDIGEGRHYNENYEIGEMGWFGPQQQAFVTDLFQHAFLQLMPEASVR